MLPSIYKWHYNSLRVHNILIYRTLILKPLLILIKNLTFNDESTENIHYYSILQPGPVY
jgi:hypothetical protein